MSDVDAPLRYAEPAEDRAARDGSIGLLVLLALGLAIAAVSLAMLTREDAEPFVLAILAGLSVIGVFSLFAGAVGILHFGERAARNDVTKALVDNLPHGALVTTSGGTILYANDAYLRLVGARDDGGIPTVERAFSGNSGVAEHIYRLSRAARQGQSWSESFSVRWPNRSADTDQPIAQWFRISVRQFPSAGSVGRRTPLTVWQLEDVTGEQRQEEGAFEKLQQVIEYLDGAPAGFFSFGRDGQIEYLNATLAQWLQLELSEASAGAMRVSDIASDDSAAVLLRAAGDVGAGTRQFDIDLMRSDGTSLPVRILFRALPLIDGQANQAHMLVLNRSEASADDELGRAAEVRFARFFHSAPIAIATVDAEGRICRTNAAFTRMLDAAGAPYSIGQTVIGGLVDTDGREAFEHALDAACSGQVAIDAVDASFGEGSGRNGRFYMSPIEQAEGEAEAAIVYAIDTTEQRALEVQIAQSQKMQAVGQLAGGIAHDFNNVLTAIIGFSELLLANHRPTDPAFQDIMNIKQNANRAAGLVRQLLAFSRQQTLRPQVLGLGDVLGDLSILLGRLLGEKVTLNVEPGRELWLVKADLHQLEQVIVNLAVNARDAMPDGGKLTIRTANVSERESKGFAYPGMQPGEYVLCEVTDNGTGMPPDVLEKIFEPFFSTKEVGKGTGLGLSTVYGIVKQTGGFIYPESEIGAGTTFRIFLPRHIEEQADDAAEASAAAEGEASQDLTGSGTILLVEDEEAVRSFAARALASRGYDVIEASTGAEALDVLGEFEGEVDLVVSDVVMPEMDGPTLLRELRKTRPDLKIIFVSGYAEDAFKKNLEQNERFVFLPKPFSLKQLAEAVKETLKA